MSIWFGLLTGYLAMPNPDPDKKLPYPQPQDIYVNSSSRMIRANRPSPLAATGVAPGFVYDIKTGLVNKAHPTPGDTLWQDPSTHS